MTFLVSPPKDTNGHFEVIKTSTIRNSFLIAHAIVNKILIVWNRQILEPIFGMFWMSSWCLRLSPNLLFLIDIKCNTDIHCNTLPMDFFKMFISMDHHAWISALSLAQVVKSMDKWRSTHVRLKLVEGTLD